MATLDATAFDYALKTRYSPEEVQNLTIDDQPFLAMVNKDTNFRGKNLVQAVKYADLAARSAGFSYAQANKAPSKGKAFTLTRVSDYAIASIDNETMEASERDEGALLQALEDEMDSAIHALKRSLGIGMFGDGSGQLGSISTISTTTITLTDAGDAMNFEVGQKLVAATAITAAPKNSGTPGTVATVDRDAGTITTSADMTATGTAWAAADELFQEGDYTAASDKNKISGLKAWIPDSAPGATAFFGVARNADAVRLGGVRQSLSGLPLNEGLVKLQTSVCKHGGRPKVVFISFSRMEQLINLLGSKVEYSRFEVGDIGFDGVKVRGPKGVMDVYADINCPYDKAYALDMRIPTLHSLNEAPHILKYKGSGYFHEATSDGIEIRVGFYGNLSLAKAPGFCGVGTSFGS